LEISDIVLRLLAASVIHSVNIDDDWIWSDGELINAPALAYLMAQSPSLNLLSLLDLKMDENHCHVLGGYSRPDLEIVPGGCTFTSAGKRAFAEVLGQNQGPTKLDWMEISNSVIANGLRENGRLKLLKFRISGSLEVVNRENLAIAGALRENKGLVHLELGHFVPSTAARLSIKTRTSTPLKKLPWSLQA
jgi:hypothetical protein